MPAGGSSRRLLQAAVIGDSETTPDVLELAEQVGALLAELGIACITGGRGGVMEAAARGAFQNDGLTIAVLPGTEMDGANEWNRIVIPTGLGHARNAVMGIAGDFAVVIGGGAGTLSEVCFAWIHGRPIFAPADTGGWAERMAREGIQPDSRASSEIIACANPGELREKLIAFIKNTDTKKEA